MSIPPIVWAAAAAAGVGATLFAFVLPALERKETAGTRLKSVAGGAPRRNAERSALAETASRRKQVADSLKEVELRTTRKVTIDALIARSGLSISKIQFFVFSALSGLVCAAGSWFMTGYRAAALAGLVVGALGLPRWFVSYLGKRRLAKFVNEFPNAMDVITRGLKAGLPLGDCLGIIASEAQDPVKGEFRAVVETMRLGVTVGDAVGRMVERMPIAEVGFFSIVINLQQKSGGNLSEGLGNLSKVLRERKKMKAKVVAMSTEAKSGAMVIGSMPIVVTLLVYFTTPAYVALLFTTTAGKVILACSFASMTLGALTMKKMISFDM